MSYYTQDKPYTIANWNQLITDVNEILQSPPEGSNCEPVSTLDIVEDPHVWTVADVQEVRAALQETCPTISFTTELVVWRQNIIDEIASKMQDAWCSCQAELEPPRTDEAIAATHSWTLIKAAVSSGWCCEAVINSSPCYICVGQHCQETYYSGMWYTNPYTWNASHTAAITATYNAAFDPLAAYVKDWYDMMESYRKMKLQQDNIDIKVSAIDRNIAMYNAATKAADRAHYAEIICNLGTAAASAQAILDTAKGVFSTAAAARSGHKASANSLAAENMAAVAALRVRFPGDKNCISDVFMDAFQGESWDEGFNPYTDKYLCEFYRFLSGSRRDGEDYLPRYSLWYTTGSSESRELFNRVNLSPDGTLIVSSGTAYAYLRRYVLTYYERKTRWRCETQVCQPGPCQFPEWDTIDLDTVHWSQDWKSTGLSGRVWAPLNVQDPAAKPVEKLWWSAYRPIGRSGANNTAKQTSFVEMCENWYDEHPAYDNRHAAYC